MSSLQAPQHEDHFGPRAPSPPSCEGFLRAPGEVVWARTDWARPVGVFFRLSVAAHETSVDGQLLQWNAFEVEELWLSRHAAFLLLQGMPLSQILIPNHRIEHPSFEEPLHAGHIVLRTEPWKYWLPQPKLTGLVVAQLGEIPDGLSSADVLGALARASAA